MSIKKIKFTSSISLYNVYASIYIRSFKHALGAIYYENIDSIGEGNFTHRSFRIWDTPHYLYLKSKPFLYLNYITKTNQTDHSIIKFNELNNEFCKKNFFNNKINTLYKSGNLIVVDGVHRLAIQKFHSDTYNMPIINFTFNNISNYEVVDNINISQYEEIIKRQLDGYKKNYFKSNSWGINGNLPAGYHSLNFFGLNIPGQRDCKRRIAKISQFINFQGKSVIDFGCNTGGMLFSIEDPAFCLGLDYDKAAISVAKKIKASIFNTGLQEYSSRFQFKACDFDKVNYEKILGELSKKYFDIALLGSLGSWVRKWRSLYSVALEVSKLIIFEENNSNEGEEQIIFFKMMGAKVTKIISGSDDDISGNNFRNTYLIEPLQSK